jgi:L-aminopeptidase/D-esterase-like protein
VTPTLPPGFTVGHWTDRERWTGCTVVLPPAGATASCEVRGGGPGTRESDVLSPAAAAQGIHGLLLAGGSAFGLAAAHGVSRYLEERGLGFATAAARVPLVAAAVVYDLALGEPARPGPDEGYSACAAAAATFERGSVGVGTGCTVGKLLGPACWTKGGFGAACLSLSGGATVTALAAVNALGEVLGETGEVAAGAWRDGAYVRSAEILRAGKMAARPWREATTLVCVLTDASLTKTQAWLVARAASAGVARAVVPSATPFDGDVAYCLAGGEAEADPLAVAALGAEVVAGAIRDAVRVASGAPGCPAASQRPPA